MPGASEDDEIKVLPCPIDAARAGRLIALWERVFGESFARFAAVLAGEEAGGNEDTVYVVEPAGAPGTAAATCRLTVAREDRGLGLLGEVATDEAFRGRGLAGRLCARARDDFARRGGQALFLATSNPSARRLYERLGWRGLPNANVMVWQPQGATLATVDPSTLPGEAFAVVEGGPALRAAIVPCITRDHPWLVLDANAAIFSTRHALQPSCEGLFGRYEAIAQRGGAWWAARSARGQVLGLASAVAVAGEGAWRIDAFAAAERSDVWLALLRAAAEAARARGGRACEACIAERDVLKQQALEAQGWTDAGPADPMCIGSDCARTRRMSEPAGR